MFQARLKASLLDERSWERAERERANCAMQRRENFLTMEDVERRRKFNQKRRETLVLLRR